MEEQITRAKERIKELEILVKHWEKQNPLASSKS
tara:strand:- start:760 stop:861 length:102 start_codon:yes stop_codon:yes gene_type:complete